MKNKISFGIPKRFELYVVTLGEFDLARVVWVRNRRDLGTFLRSYYKGFFGMRIRKIEGVYKEMFYKLDWKNL